MKLVMVCPIHKVELVYSWEVHDYVCPKCGGKSAVFVSENKVSNDKEHSKEPKHESI